jgi:hypothetical protein
MIRRFAATCLNLLLIPFAEHLAVPRRWTRWISEKIEGREFPEDD